MSQINRIRNAIRPFSQVQFTHAEGSRNKVFINTLTGERTITNVPFSTLSDAQAKSIAAALQVADSDIPALLTQAQQDIETLRTGMMAQLTEQRALKDLSLMAGEYEDLMGRLPRIQNYLRKATTACA